MFETPRRGGSNEYSQSMFLNKNKKNNVYPCKLQFYYIKVGFKGINIIYAYFRDDLQPKTVKLHGPLFIYIPVLNMVHRRHHLNSASIRLVDNFIIDLTSETIVHFRTGSDFFAVKSTMTAISLTKAPGFITLYI